MGNVVHKIAEVGSDIGHGIESVAKGVGHAVTHPLETVEDAGKDIAHAVTHPLDTIENVAKDAEKGVHVALKEAGRIGSAADEALVTVGNGVAAVVKHIPVVGGTIAKGIKGATDLSHLEGKAFKWVGNAVTHPIDAIHSAIDTVKNPNKLLDAGKSLVKYGQRAAGDAANVASAFKYVAPELAPELDGIAAVGNLVAHPTVDGVMTSLTKFVPKGGKLEKAVKFATKVAKYAGKAKKAYNVTKNAYTMAKMVTEKPPQEQDSGQDDSENDQDQTPQNIAKQKYRQTSADADFSSEVENPRLVDVRETHGLLPVAPSNENERGSIHVESDGGEKCVIPYWGVVGSSSSAPSDLPEWLHTTDVLDDEKMIVLPYDFAPHADGVLETNGSSVVPFYGRHQLPAYSRTANDSVKPKREYVTNECDRYFDDDMKLLRYLTDCYGAHMVHCFRQKKWIGSIDINGNNEIVGTYVPFQ